MPRDRLHTALDADQLGPDGLPVDYGDPVAELEAALRGVALVDRSNLARLRGTGPDLLGLLHRLSTGDVGSLETGGGAPTVLTTPKGRIVERLLVAHGHAGVWLIAGAGNAKRVLEHLARFTFAEQLGLGDAGERSRLFSLVGPRADDVLRAAGLSRPADWQVAEAVLGGVSVELLGHDGESALGCSILAPCDGAESVWDALAAPLGSAAGRPAGSRALEARRILLGIPASGAELTEDYNPLEAGLNDAISFTKGCYVGQEVVARLNTYDKVSRALVGLELASGSPPDPGAPLFCGDAAVGEVTSAARLPDASRIVGLGYVKLRGASVGDRVRVGAPDGDEADLVDRPLTADSAPRES